jgi:hypothetical protein
MHVKLRIDKAHAIDKASATAGLYTIELDDAFIADLAPREREKLKSYAFDLADYPPACLYGPNILDAIPEAPFASLDAVKASLTEIVTRQMRDELMEHMRHEDAVRFALASEPEDLLNDSWGTWGREQYREGHSIPWSDPRLEARRAEVDALVKLANERVHAEKLAAEAEAKAAQALVEAEAAKLVARNKAEVRAWITRHAPVLLPRFEAGFLPEAELDDAMRDYAFRDFAACERYDRLRGKDLQHDSECEDRRAVFEHGRCDGMSDAQFDVYLRIDAIASKVQIARDVEVQAIEHRAYCHGCDGQAVRLSVKVMLVFINREFARHFAL